MMENGKWQMENGSDACRSLLLPFAIFHFPSREEPA
jgi:hypothetical protein